MNSADKVFAVAPMMEWTDRHFRYLARLMSRQTLLYTEMITSSALVHGDRKRFLHFNPSEHPIALQLGGSDPRDMAASAKWGEQAGYDEVNINVGCPSDRVQSGKFGVCLMKEPRLVAECVTAMGNESSLPITVKCRLGVDEFDSYEFLTEFIQTIADAGCNTFIVHARKAWLKGLNPKQNREIPELDYQRVYNLKNDFSELKIIINGGIDSIEQVKQHLNHVDGVMIGRHAYKQPKFLLQVDQQLFAKPQDTSTTLENVIVEYTKYMQQNINNGVPFKCMAKHMLNLYQNVPGAKLWRRHLSENMHKPGAGVELIFQALEVLNKKCA